MRLGGAGRCSSSSSSSPQSFESSKSSSSGGVMNVRSARNRRLRACRENKTKRKHNSAFPLWGPLARVLKLRWGEKLRGALLRGPG